LLARNALYLAGTLTASLLQYVYQFVSGRLLGRAAYGELAALIAAVFLLTLPQNVVSTIATRFGAAAKSREDWPAIGGLTIRLSAWMLGLSLALAGLLVIGGRAIAQFLGISGGTEIPILALIATVFLLLAVSRGILQGLQRFGWLAVNFIVDAGARVLAAVILINAGFAVTGALLAVAVGPLLAYGHTLFGLRGYLRGGIGHRTSQRRLAMFGLWVALGLSGVTFLFNVDVILARHYLSPDEAGVYAAAAVLGRVVYITTFAVAQVMFPEVTVLRSRGARHFHVVELSMALIVLLATPILIIYVFAPGVVLFFFGEAFRPVAPFLGPFALALTALSLSNLLINYQLSTADARFIVPLALACLLEPALIVAFHQTVGQIVLAVLVANLVLLAALGGLYLWGRFGGERQAVELV
jgi:O-antigen/teichoic acid export membrane protein